MSTFEDEKLCEGRSLTEIGRDVAIRSSHLPDDIVRIAGLPPYYQWEDWPQDTWNPGLYDTLCKCQELAQLADGFLLSSVEELEPEAVADIEHYMRPKDVFCLGPQFSTAVANVPGNDPAIGFLDVALAKHGPQSALYISFGSGFFPPTEYVHILIGSLLSLQDPMPFLFHCTTSTSRPAVTEEDRRKWSGSGHTMGASAGYSSSSGCWMDDIALRKWRDVRIPCRRYTRHRLAVHS